jgi:hypothetical protein
MRLSTTQESSGSIRNLQGVDGSPPEGGAQRRLAQRPSHCMQGARSARRRAISGSSRHRSRHNDQASLTGWGLIWGRDTRCLAAAGPECSPGQRWLFVGLFLRAPGPSAFCSSGRRPEPLRARDTHPTSRTSNQGVLWPLSLLAAHRTWQHLHSSGDREQSMSREVSS